MKEGDLYEKFDFILYVGEGKKRIFNLYCAGVNWNTPLMSWPIVTVYMQIGFIIMDESRLTLNIFSHKQYLVNGNNGKIKNELVISSYKLDADDMPEIICGTTEISVIDCWRSIKYLGALNKVTENPVITIMLLNHFSNSQPTEGQVNHLKDLIGPGTVNGIQSYIPGKQIYGIARERARCKNLQFTTN